MCTSEESFVSLTEQLPANVLHKWQDIVDLLAQLTQLPAALIMKSDPPYMEVFKTNVSEANPYKVGDRDKLAGQYCEKVIKTQSKVIIPNAPEDHEWSSAPEIKVGMIAYLGMPLLWPNGKIFGTICLLDSKPNNFNNLEVPLLESLREIIQINLQVVYQNDLLQQKNAQLKAQLKEIEDLRKMFSVCAWCKKVRNDEGNWENMEHYLHRKANFDFSHGMCPDCLEKYSQKDADLP